MKHGVIARHPTKMLFTAIPTFIVCCCAIPCTSCSKNAEDSGSRLNNLPQNFVNTAGMVMVRMQAGEYQMGAAREAASADLQKLERVRTVVIDKPFYIAACEVTNSQFLLFLEESQYLPSEPSSDFLQHLNTANMERPGCREPECPVVWVNVTDAEAFCAWLSQREDRTYRLPTDEEWEYACRATSVARYCFGDSISTLEEYAWYSANAGTTPHAVGTKRANAWGLFDMHGNVWEWCGSVMPNRYLQGSEFAGHRCFKIRGGSIASGADSCRCAAAWGALPRESRRPEVGFRVVFDQ